MPAVMRKVCRRRSGGSERRYLRSASIATLHGPSPRRTCCNGNGMAFQETFSRLMGLPSLRTVLTTGSCGESAFNRVGRNVDPAATAAAVRKFRRDNDPE